MVEAQRRSALENSTSDVAGIRELRPRAIVQICGAPDDLQARLGHWQFDSQPQALKAVAAEDAGLFWTAPDQYLLVSRTQSHGELCLSLEAQLGDSGATLVDLSHARTVFEISGPHARDILAKGCPLDVDSLVVGDCVPTLLGHFNVLLYCRAQSTFQLFVFRSFGLACMEWLVHAAREFQA